LKESNINENEQSIDLDLKIVQEGRDEVIKKVKITMKYSLLNN